MQMQEEEEQEQEEVEEKGMDQKEKNKQEEMGKTKRPVDDLALHKENKGWERELQVGGLIEEVKGTTGPRYAFVVRTVQSLGGDTFELKENTVTIVDKVNEEDNIATCSFQDLIGLFPLDALKLGTPIAHIPKSQHLTKDISLPTQVEKDDP